MSEASAIEWTDSTFNPWIGCTKVGPGCDHCYAEALMDVRHRRVQWGAGQPRVRTSADNWNGPVSWNKHPFYECLDCGARFAPPRKREGFITCPGCGKHGGKHTDDEDDAAHVKQVRRRVFCASLADVFDNEVNLAWRADLFELMLATPNLDWLVLTKRVGNIRSMVPRTWVESTFHRDGWPSHVWLGATVVNQEEADRDIPKLLAVPAAVRFLSCEPLLGPLDLAEPLNGCPVQVGSGGPDTEPEWQQTAPPLDWIIAGGESGHSARPMHPEWARSLRDQCQAANVPFLFKQWGEWGPMSPSLMDEGPQLLGAPISGNTLLLPDPDDRNGGMARYGKKANGRKLDGREWNGFPEVT